MTSLSLGSALIALLGGLASFFSPCVAPLAPGYISYISSLTPGEPAQTATSGETNWRVRLRGPATVASVLFVAGFSVAFIALGLLFATFGGLLLAYRPVMQTIAGIVMLVMGIFLLGWLPQSVTEFLMRERRWQMRRAVARRLGWSAPFALGVVFAAGWTPCIGPVLTSVLLFVSANSTLGQGAALLAFYSLGFAIPFLAIGVGWSFSLRALGWAKRYSGQIARVSGVALILVSLLYLTGEVSVISTWAQRFAIGLGPRAHAVWPA
ncbi:MAG TPA: cytochrome c biogenesis protein CcdA [Ktedonobacterales bacterium]